jgi:hypothetical protein
LGVAQRVIAPDGDEGIDLQILDVPQHVGRDVDDGVLVLVGEVGRDGGSGQFLRIRPRGVEERSAGAAGAVHAVLGQLGHAIAGIGLRVGNEVDQSRPAASNADDPIPVAQGTDGDRANGGIESRHVAAAGEDGHRSLPHWAFLQRPGPRGFGR